MNTARILIAAALVFCLRAPALTVQDCHSLEGMLEEPPGVRIVASHGFVPSAENDERFAVEDAAVADFPQETASLVLEVAGPRTLRLFHRGGWPNTGGYMWLRLDGRVVREFRPMPVSTDVTVPAGVHHVELLTSATPVALYKVVDLVPGLPVLTQPDITLPAGDGVSLRLPVESDSPVTWSAAGLPDGLTLDPATGRITGVGPDLIGSAPPVIAWVTMTNAHGSQVEQLRIWGMNPLHHVSLVPFLAGRRARLEGTVEFLYSTDATPPEEAYIGRPFYYDDRAAMPELVTTVHGPDTLRFRSRGSSETPGPVIVKADGVLVLRQFARVTAWDEFSVAIPTGEHELTWQFPPGGRIDRVRLESAVGPRLRGPFALTTAPGVPFSYTLGAARGGQFHSDALPAGVTLDQNPGVLSGTLPEESDYLFPVTVQSGDESDTALYHLQVRDNATAALGTPGLTWLQSPQPPSWEWHSAGPQGAEVWEFFAINGGRELSRMETVIQGPERLACRFLPMGNGTLEIELDGMRYAVSQSFPGWENLLSVEIPPGRHVLALRAVKAGEFWNGGGVQLYPLQLAGAGAPVVRIPPLLYTDGTPVRVPFNIPGGAAANVTVSGLPEGLSVHGSEITGSMAPSPAQLWSVFSASRSGQTAAVSVEWRHNEVNEWIDSTGWYGYTDSIFGVAPNAAPDSWDGIAALLLLQHHYGSRETGIARLITGPDTLTFRRRSQDAVRLEVKMDGAVVHGELVNTAVWQQVSIVIPAGEHHVTVSARPEHMDDGSAVTQYDSGEHAYLMLDDFRLASELSPAITDATRRLEAMPGENFAFRPQSERKIEEWSLTGAPPGFEFDTRTGTLSAAAVSAPPGEYSLIFTAGNAHGSDEIRVALAVVAPPAHGDSPKLFLQKLAWDFEPENFEPPVPVDGADVHYAMYNSLGTMSAWVEGPDTMQFWWRFMTGDTFFVVQVDDEIVYRPASYLPLEWRRQEIAIPPGRHLVTWYGYDTVAMDHITLASDGVPQPQTQQVYVVDPAGFSLQLTARNAPLAWDAEQFTISATGVLSGVFDPAEEQTVRLSASNAAGTGYALITLRPQTDLNAVLDSPLVWSGNPDAWWPEAPAPGVLPAPADGEDFLRSNADAANPLSVEIPSGGGLLSLWAKSVSSGKSVEVSGGPDQTWHPRFVFELPDTDWHRILIPLHDEANYVLEIVDSEWASHWFDRAELLRPGDPIIDLCPLPEIRAGAPYTAQLKLITGGPVRWEATGLPAGLTLESVTGIIGGTMPAGTPVTDHELRITALRADGRSTFAWMKLRVELDPGSVLDTQDLVWRRTTTGGMRGRGWEPVTEARHGWPARDLVDMLVVNPPFEGMSTVETEVEGPGTISFWWDGDDYTLPVFLVDGVIVARPDPFRFSNNLQYYSRSIAAGHHTLSWVIEGSGGSDGNEARLDRVQWSRDGAPRFDNLSFDHEAAPGSPIVWPVTVNGASTFSSTDLPAWLTFHPATGTITGTTPPAEGIHSFTLAIEQDGRRDHAVFHLSVREPLEPVAGGEWFRSPNSHWLPASDGAGGTLAVFSPGPDDPYFEELRLAVTAPCVVTFRTLLGTPLPSPAIYVRADLQPQEAHYYRGQSGGSMRGAVTVPGSGIAFVHFRGYRSFNAGTVQLDDVRVFPWDADANGDGLSNGVACALARWPDESSPGDPPLLITPHPSLPDFRLICFGSAGGDAGLVQLRNYGIRFQLEQSSGLDAWESVTATEETAGAFARCWKIPAPPAPRTFHRVQARPLIRVP